MPDDAKPASLLRRLFGGGAPPAAAGALGAAKIKGPGAGPGAGSGAGQGAEPGAEPGAGQGGPAAFTALFGAPVRPPALVPGLVPETRARQRAFDTVGGFSEERLREHELARERAAAVLRDEMTARAAAAAVEAAEARAELEARAGDAAADAADAAADAVAGQGDAFAPATPAVRLVQEGRPEPPPYPGGPAGLWVAPPDYFSPQDLSPSRDLPVTALVVGSCLTQAMFAPRYRKLVNWDHDFVLVNSIVDALAPPPRLPAAYDFQLIQLPLRWVIPSNTLMDLAWNDVDGFAAAFDEACARLELFLQRVMQWNVEHGLLSFVCNFYQPQFPGTGLLLPRHDLRNMEYFIARLNEVLEQLVGAYKNAYVMDVDRLCASMGRRYIQDDVFTPYAHNSMVVPLRRLRDDLHQIGYYYDLRAGLVFRDAFMAHVRALHRAVLQKDPVKLIVTDLDNTLWSGVIGDMDEIGPGMLEGWPLGYIEALRLLARRGILLAILSKNDEDRVLSNWEKILGGVLPLSAFAGWRINWEPKAHNMKALLAAMNLLPRNVVFVDDNPVERAQMQAAFPDMRVLGDNPFHTRRVLMMAAETQAAVVTDESARRTDMMQAQLRRESERASLSLEDFARQQQVEGSLSWLSGAGDPRFARALELINKTNQFNTTGRRWRAEELTALLEGGGRIAVLTVKDKYTDYGLVGVCVIRGTHILQWVMSCRVLGTGVERSALRAVVQALRADGDREITASLVRTDVNKPCHTFLPNAGFAGEGEAVTLPAGVLPEAAAYVDLRV